MRRGHRMQNRRGAVRVEPRFGAPPGAVAKVDLPPGRMQPRAWFALTAATVLLMAALGMVAVDYLARDGAFPIVHLAVEMEARHATRAEVLAAARPAVQGNYFAVDLDAVAAAVAALPMVRAVEVRRRWPDSLHLRVAEHRPLARWGGGGIVNADGTLVKFAARAAPAALPLLGAPEHALAEAAQRLRQWQQRLQGRGLRLEKLTVTPRLSWSAVVRAGGADAGGAVQLLFGREQVERRLARFIGGYENGLRAVFHRVRRVDLRYPDGFAVQWTAGGEGERELRIPAPASD